MDFRDNLNRLKDQLLEGGNLDTTLKLEEVIGLMEKQKDLCDQYDDILLILKKRLFNEKRKQAQKEVRQRGLDYKPYATIPEFIKSRPPMPSSLPPMPKSMYRPPMPKSRPRQLDVDLPPIPKRLPPPPRPQKPTLLPKIPPAIPKRKLPPLPKADLPPLPKAISTKSKSGKPLTKYQLFVKTNYPLIKEDYPHLTPQEIMFSIGEYWNSLK
jgi:hypothetical protein